MIVIGTFLALWLLASQVHGGGKDLPFAHQKAARLDYLWNCRYNSDRVDIRQHRRLTRTKHPSRALSSSDTLTDPGTSPALFSASTLVFF